MMSLRSALREDESDYEAELERRRPVPRRPNVNQEDASDRTPLFLRENYERIGQSPLVLRERRDGTEDHTRPTKHSPERVDERTKGSSGSIDTRLPKDQTGIGRSISPFSEMKQKKEAERQKSTAQEKKHAVEAELARLRDQEMRHLALDDYAAMIEDTKTTRYVRVDKVVWDATQTKDLTLHMELDITEDLQTDLDELCRLGRLGNFHLANDLFRANLEHHMDDPYVFVQYAQMLMEMGDYKTIDTLRPPDSLVDSGSELLLLNWRLLKSLSILHSEGLVERGERMSTDEVTRVANFIPFKTLKIEDGDDDQAALGYLSAGNTRKAAGIDLDYPFPEDPSEKPGVKPIQGAKFEDTQSLSKQHGAAQSGGVLPTSSQQRFRDTDADPAELERLREALNKVKEVPDEETKIPFGSTECQIFSLAVEFLAESLKDHHLEGRTFPWRSIYENLLRQGHIWDFRDVFIGAVGYFGQRLVCGEMFKMSVPESHNQIIQDWSTGVYDESTNLGLLDILVSSIIAEDLSGESIRAAGLIMEQAGHFASSIVQLDPSNLRSRQYLRWILVKVTLSSFKDSATYIVPPGITGLFIHKHPGFEPAIYVPATSEAPEWKNYTFSANSHETMQMVLKAVRQMGDLKTEAMCLKLMILHSEEPGKYFDELIHLQKSVQHDLIGWLKTCLSKYIICKDQKSRGELREEILSVKGYHDMYAWLVWARSMVLRALAHSQHEGDLLLQEALNELQDTPDWTTINAMMKRNGLIKSDALHPTERSTSRFTTAPKERQALSPMINPMLPAAAARRGSFNDDRTNGEASKRGQDPATSMETKILGLKDLTRPQFNGKEPTLNKQDEIQRAGSSYLGPPARRSPPTSRYYGLSQRAEISAAEAVMDADKLRPLATQPLQPGEGVKEEIAKPHRTRHHAEKWAMTNSPSGERSGIMKYSPVDESESPFPRLQGYGNKNRTQEKSAKPSAPNAPADNSEDNNKDNNKQPLSENPFPFQPPEETRNHRKRKGKKPSNWEQIPPKPDTKVAKEQDTAEREDITILVDNHSVSSWKYSSDEESEPKVPIFERPPPVSSTSLNDDERPRSPAQGVVEVD